MFCDEYSKYVLMMVVFSTYSTVASMLKPYMETSYFGVGLLDNTTFPFRYLHACIGEIVKCLLSRLQERQFFSVFAKNV